MKSPIQLAITAAFVMDDLLKNLGKCPTDQVPE